MMCRLVMLLCFLFLDAITFAFYLVCSAEVVSVFPPSLVQLLEPAVYSPVLLLR